MAHFVSNLRHTLRQAIGFWRFRLKFGDPLLTADDVAKRLNVSTDWVWDHSSRKKPLLPVIRMGDGTLRYRPSGIEAFIDERERASSMGRRAG
jgi:predicted DNA-binding transcriptional regulator AlpA